MSGNTLSNGLRDSYEGGFGRDTLRLELTSAEWARADVQSDVAAFLVHLAQPLNQFLNPLGLATHFSFSVTSLTVFNIENLQISVNGVLLDPRDEAVTAVLDRINATEYSASVSVDLLANDAVPDRAVSVQLFSNSTLGTLVLTPALGGAAQSATLTFAPNAALQSLAAGQSVSETISYRVTDADGDTSTASITITVVGQNDGATISGISTGAVAEDSTALVSGSLTVSDVDNGEAVFKAASGLTGTYGSFTFNAVSGAWTYDLNDAAANVQALRAGETVSDRITVTSQDGTASQVVVVTITGTNDAPTVAVSPSVGSTTDATVVPGDGDLIPFGNFEGNPTPDFGNSHRLGAANGWTLTGGCRRPERGEQFLHDVGVGSLRRPRGVPQPRRVDAAKHSSAGRPVCRNLRCDYTRGQSGGRGLPDRGTGRRPVGRPAKHQCRT
ncbi:VCBS domain-containing protein [Paragemmobacter aquarius]|uniref:VCBS domain-containing protein n=1 Tax=Paragemmobacter aquarius TaxID=2169400 RepID=UPI001C1FD11B|nr:VCBS domain-containing protein [Gemmobacter aquarius]